MNSNEILNELNKLSNNNYNVVLIDGPWGSGKTYLINKFIKENKDKINIYYVSMLGKKNVDDINTSLYGEVNKISKIKITNLIPSAINALNEISGDKDLEFVLKIKNKKAKCIIILDDLERYASSDYDEFLAYISNLVLRGSKIICVSNLLELGSGERYNFNLYKEKIFDRVYKAELFNNDVIREKFHEYANYLDKIIINLFNKNFRIVEKVYNFSNEVITKLIDLKIRLKDEDYKAIIYYSTILLNVYFDNKKLRLEDFNIRPSQSSINYNKISFKEEDDAWTSIFIYEYSLNTLYLYKYENEYIFIAKLLKAYLYDDYNGLTEYYSANSFDINRIKRTNLINLEDLLSISDNININNYDELLNLLETKITNPDLIIRFLNVYESTLSKENKEFFNKLKDNIELRYEEIFINKVIDLFKMKKFNEFYKIINDNIYLLIDEHDKKIDANFKRFNYFLNLNDEENLFRYKTFLFNYIDVLNKSSMKNDLLNYLENLKNKTDLVMILIKKLTYVKEEVQD